MSEIVHRVRGEKHRARLVQLKQKRHVARRVAWRLKQTDRAVAEEIQLAFDSSPIESGLLEVRADVSVRVRRFCGACSVELSSLHDHGRVGKVSECAGVVDVQVGLHDVADRVRRDAKLA